MAHYSKWREARRVQPEWLDTLPSSDPRAIRSRRDLRLLNRIMGHARIVRQALEVHVDAVNPCVADLGAGDGTLLLRSLAARAGAEVVLVDRHPAVEPATAAAYHERGLPPTSEAADVFDWLERGTERFDAVVANLFLHHFEDPALGKLLALIARRTRLFVACEPRRARVPRAGTGMLRINGCTEVTRHDAALSVEAGFRGRELSQLWPAREGWRLAEGARGLFSHCFVAHETLAASPQ
ncbi:MAG: methyltransferase domain-containing protein [Burkholderiales bacterium]